MFPRLAYQILIFGNGDSSQFGMGPNATGEYPRPRLQRFLKTASDEGRLGGEDAGVVKLVAGGLHTLAIDEAGKIWAWGTIDDGALGRIVEGPDPGDPSKTIDSVVAESTPTVLETLVDEEFRAVSVAAGNSVSVALSADGRLKAWGSFRRSKEGAFGFDGTPGSAQIQYLPTSPPTLTRDCFVQAACGGDHCLALTDTGRVYVWGVGEQFQLGRKVLERHKKRGLFPEKLHLRNIVSIGCGAYHSFAIDTNGIVYAWGLNDKRQCGIPGAEDQVLQPTPIPALHPDKLGHGARVIQAVGGNHQSLFVTSDGRVYGCGTVTDSQLGLGADHPAVVNPEDEEAKCAMSEPVLIPFPPPPTAYKLDPDVGPYAEASAYPPRTPIARVSPGTDYSLAVSRSGHVYSWGDGQSCELGLTQEGDDEASVVQQKTPKRIIWKNVDNWFVRDASAGGQHCVLLARKLE